MAAVLILAGCASNHRATSVAEQASIGPYPAFTGRLIVMEPTKRWQVLLTWRASTPDRGWLRITHAATNTVIEMRWRGDTMELRDNRQPAWQPVGRAKLAEHGIVIAPRELATFLLGQVPAQFHNISTNRWESRRDGAPIRLQWMPQSRKLTMSDLKHGRRAILIIQP